MISGDCAAKGLSLVIWYLSLGWLEQVVSGPECESQHRKWLRCGLWLVGLNLENVFTGELFTIHKNWLTLGGAATTGSGRPQMSKIQKIKEMVDIILREAFSAIPRKHLAAYCLSLFSSPLSSRHFIGCTREIVVPLPRARIQTPSELICHKDTVIFPVHERCWDPFCTHSTCSTNTFWISAWILYKWIRVASWGWNFQWQLHVWILHHQ